MESQVDYKKGIGRELPEEYWTKWNRGSAWWAEDWVARELGLIHTFNRTHGYVSCEKCGGGNRKNEGCKRGGCKRNHEGEAKDIVPVAKEPPEPKKAKTGREIYGGSPYETPEQLKSDKPENKAFLTLADILFSCGFAAQDTLRGLLLLLLAWRWRGRRGYHFLGDYRFMVRDDGRVLAKGRR